MRHIATIGCSIVFAACTWGGGVAMALPAAIADALAEPMETPAATNPVAPRAWPSSPPEITAPTLAAPITRKRLPATVSDLCVGGGGRFLVFHMERLHRFEIFDVNEADVVRRVPAPKGRFLFAAGRHELYVVLPEARTIEGYDLLTGKRAFSAPLPVDGLIRNLAIGSDSTGPLFVVTSSPTGSPSLHFLDPQTLTPSGVKVTGDLSAFRQTTLVDGRWLVNTRASADGSLFGWRTTGISPDGIRVIKIVGGEARIRCKHSAAGYVVPGPDGKRVFTAQGVFSADLDLLDSAVTTGRNYLPAAEGEVFMSVPGHIFDSPRKGFISLKACENEAPLKTFPDLEVDVELRRGAKPLTLAFDKRFHMIPKARLIIVVPETHDALDLISYDPPTVPSRAVLPQTVPADPTKAITCSPEELYEKVLAGAPVPGPAGLPCKLPAEPTALRPGLWGACLVIHFEALDKLGIYNVAQAKFDTFIPVPDNVKFAAGGERLLLYLPGAREFQVWNLLNFHKTQANANILGEEVDCMEMGLFNSKKALIRVAGGYYAILDVDTLKVSKIPAEAFGQQRPYCDRNQMRPDDRFTSVALWSRGVVPPGLLWARLGPGGISDAVYKHEEFGCLTISHDSSKVFCSWGFVLDTGGWETRRNSNAAASFFAVRGGNSYLEIKQKLVKVRDVATDEEVNFLVLPFALPVQRYSKDRLPDDRKVHAIAPLNRACFVDASEPAIHTFELRPPAGSKPDAKTAAKPVRPPREWFEQRLKGAPRPGPGGLKRMMPAPPKDVRPGLWGTCLVMHLKELGRLGVFDIAKAEFGAYIPVPGDVLYAAGGDKLLLYLPGQREFQIWNLATRGNVLSRTSGIKGVVLGVEMGVANPNRALVTYADSSFAVANRRYAVMDLTSFLVVDLPPECSGVYDGRPQNRGCRENVHMRVNEDCTAMVVWNMQSSMCACARLSGAGGEEGCSFVRHFAWLSVGRQTGRIYSSPGGILDAKGQTTADLPGALLAVMGGDLFLQVQDKRVVVRDAYEHSELSRFDLPIGTTLRTPRPNEIVRNPGDPFTGDRRIHASADLNRICFVADDLSAIRIHELGLDMNEPRVRETVTGVRRGTRWTRTLDVPDGTALELEAAPPGVVCDSASRTLSWQIPATFSPGNVALLVRVSQPGKDDYYERVVVSVRSADGDEAAEPPEPKLWVRSPTPFPSPEAQLTLDEVLDRARMEALAPPSSGLRRALPEAPAGSSPALAGAYMVMHFKKMGTLGVFNVARARFDAYIPAPEDSVFAAGGDKLLLYVQKDREYQLWDLTRLKKTASMPGPAKGWVGSLGMGLFNARCAIACRHSGATSGVRRWFVELMDLEAFGQGHTGSCSRTLFTSVNNVHFAPLEDFTSVASWEDVPFNREFTMLSLVGKNVVNSFDRRCEYRGLALGLFGERIYATHGPGQGAILDAQGKVIRTCTRQPDWGKGSFHPVSGGDYYLEVLGTNVTVRNAFDHSEIVHFDLPFGPVIGRERDVSRHTVCASAQLDRACFVNTLTPAVHIFSLGLAGKAPRVTDLAQVAAPGVLWTRKMNYPAGTKVTLQSGPAGMRYDPTASTLSWNAAVNLPSNAVPVMLAVTLPGQQETYHRVVVPVCSTGAETMPSSANASLPPPPPRPTLAAHASLPLDRLFEQVLSTAPLPGPKGLRKWLPESPQLIRSALGGAYLVMHFKGLGKLGCFNVAQADFETFIPVPDNVRLSAGGRNLLLYLPAQNVFKVWDMVTLKELRSIPSPIKEQPAMLERGFFDSRTVRIGYTVGGGGGCTWHGMVLDLVSFETREVAYNDKSLLFNHDADAAFAAKAMQDVLDLAIKKPGSAYTAISPPATIGEKVLLEMKGTRVIVRERDNNDEIHHFELPFNAQARAGEREASVDGGLVYVASYLNRACFIDPKEPAAYVFELGLGKSVAEVRDAVKGVHRGALWTRKMGYPEGTVVSVEDAPENVKYDAAADTLSWQVPADQPSGNVTFLLAVTYPGKDEEYRRLVVSVR